MDKDGNGMIGYGEFLEMVLRQVRYFFFYSAIIFCRHMLIFPGRREGDTKRLSPDRLQPFQVAGGHCRMLKIVLCTNPKTETIFWHDRCPKYGAFDRGTIFPNKSYLS